jgi:hypothetical protein
MKRVSHSTLPLSILISTGDATFGHFRNFINFGILFGARIAEIGAV